MNYPGFPWTSKILAKKVGAKNAWIFTTFRQNNAEAFRATFIEGVDYATKGKNNEYEWYESAVEKWKRLLAGSKSSNIQTSKPDKLKVVEATICAESSPEALIRYRSVRDRVLDKKDMMLHAMMTHLNPAVEDWMFEWEGRLWLTTNQLAAFYNVESHRITENRNETYKEEFDADGVWLWEKKESLKGYPLDLSKVLSKHISKNTPSSNLYPLRACVRMGFILEKSPVAAQLRTLSLDKDEKMPEVMEAARKAAIDSYAACPGTTKEDNAAVTLPEIKDVLRQVLQEEQEDRDEDREALENRLDEMIKEMTEIKKILAGKSNSNREKISISTKDWHKKVVKKFYDGRCPLTQEKIVDDNNEVIRFNGTALGEYDHYFNNPNKSRPEETWLISKKAHDRLSRNPALRIEDPEVEATWRQYQCRLKKIKEGEGKQGELFSNYSL